MEDELEQEVLQLRQRLHHVHSMTLKLWHDGDLDEYAVCAILNVTPLEARDYLRWYRSQFNGHG
jgi:hypothetical protein